LKIKSDRLKSRATPGRKDFIMKVVMAFTLSQGVSDWLIEKKKNSVNLSAFVNKALEDVRIKELEGDTTDEDS
jgi:hypothetical protein